MRFKYNFTKQGLDKIPIVDVNLINPEDGSLVKIEALLDSGAFTNVFHSDVAPLLGIDLDRITDEIVFGGVEKSKRQMSGKKCVVDMEVEQRKIKYKFSSLVIFSDQVNDIGHPLLGRIGFFDQFDSIVFDNKRNKFYLNIDSK